MNRNTTDNQHRLAVKLQKCLVDHRASHLSHYGLTAGTTHSFSDRLHAQLVEVGLQAAEHVVQLVDLSRRSAGNAALPLGHNLKRSNDEDSYVLKIRPTERNMTE